MRVEVRLFASLVRFAPEGKGSAPCEVVVEQGTTVAGLLDKLGVPEETVKIVFVNGVHAGGDRSLEDGDRVGVFPPVAGG